MALDATKAIYDALIAYPHLSPLLAVYNGRPAIFSSRPVPADAPRPFVSMNGNDSERELPGVNFTGQVVTRDIFAYAKNTGSAADIEAIARQIRKALHRAKLSAAGGEVIQTLIVGGGVAPTDTNLIGRYVVVQISFVDS